MSKLNEISPSISAIGDSLPSNDLLILTKEFTSQARFKPTGTQNKVQLLLVKENPLGTNVCTCMSYIVPQLHVWKKTEISAQIIVSGDQYTYTLVTQTVSKERELALQNISQTPQDKGLLASL
jgi:hypothetical protein